MLDLVGLLDLDADAHTVDTRLDEDALVLVAGHGQGVQEDFRRRLGLDFGDIMPFRGLGGEVGQRERRSERGADTLEVRSEGLRLPPGVSELLE